MSQMMGLGDLTGEDAGRKLHETLEVVQKISAQFKDYVSVRTIKIVAQKKHKCWIGIRQLTS